LLRDANRLDEAVVHFRRSCELDPTLSHAHAGLGQISQEVGRLDDARLSFRRAIAADPKALVHYLSLAHITRFVPGDPDLVALLGLSGEIGSLSDDDQITAHFALGKALADIGEHEESFAHFLAGNALRRRVTKYDQTRFLGGLQRIKDTFTKAYLSAWPTSERCSELPIFIVGMPRSGSTLIEQILASHPKVVCAGETNAFRDALQANRDGTPDWLNPNPNFIPTHEQLSDIAQDYLDLLEKVAAGLNGNREHTRITNKMLGNYRYIGLITKLFPNAKIIHAVRDPVETCLSCFSINFVNQPFAFDLQELGQHYRGYNILMRHWRSTLPKGAIFDVRYEAVVDNLEKSARAIIAYCGLEWDDQCLRFYEAERPVRTASVEQVRRPIYKSSVRRWRPDVQTLQPLLKGLGVVIASDSAS
jgi:tetratricopeptide (TPR) repeat protein